MTKICGWILALSLLMGLCACGQKELAPTWQEQYDLGIRYLSEGNYEEAIIAFNAAIEIDPKQEDAYQKAAEAYLAMNNHEAAAEILRQGVEETSSKLLTVLLQNLSVDPTSGLLQQEIGPDGKNSYGGTPFIRRYAYQAFDTLDELTQERVVTLAQAAIEGNRETLLSLVTAAGIGGRFYTTWNGYKIEIFDRQDWVYHEEATSRGKELTIQLRPENGIGYYCEVDVFEKLDPAGEDFWLDYRAAVDIVSCPCVNWQWNGVVSVETYSEYIWKHSDGSTRREVDTASVNGTMVDGVWEGTAVETWQRSEDGSGMYYDDYHYDSTGTTTRVFQNGILIEQDTPIGDYSRKLCFINHYSGLGTVHFEQWRILDDRYW